MDETLIKKHIETLGCTREEAIQLILEDEETDGMSVGEINRELTPEQRKAVKDNSKTTSGKKTERKPREKKVDADKAHLIKMLEVPLINFSHAVINPEREITFIYNDAEYSITLTRHRPKK